MEGLTVENKAVFFLQRSVEGAWNIVIFTNEYMKDHIFQLRRKI